MTDNLILELRKLGLKDKEVRTYLAGLELGPASVQNIAKKAGVVRPTAHEIIKHLKEKGLFTETVEKKKRHVIAQSPESVLGLLRRQKREIEEREREFIRIVAALESRYYAGERGGVSVFHGEEGIRMLEEKISFASTPEILVFSSRENQEEKKRREKIYAQIKKRLGTVTPKELYTSSVPGTLVIFDQAVFFPAENLKGYLVENQLVCELLKSLFNLRC